MPKKKFLTEGKHKGKKPVPVPQTADDFLASGVELEESGEKWRAGDAAKSARFFLRAVDVYTEALYRFSTSFDLAYNLARLQLELSQQPRLLEHVPSTPVELLRAALDSHKLALSLDSKDANTLFNTAQVLQSLAESADDDALGLLKEAFGCLEECLKVQQASRAESFRQQSAFTEGLLEKEENHTEEVSTREDNDGQWASIVEPVTNSTLLETETALLQGLTAIVPLITDDTKALQEVEATASRFSRLANDISPDISSDVATEYLQQQANLLAVLADASFRLSLVSAETYFSTLTTAFSSSPGLAASAPALCDLAEAFITFNSTIGRSFQLNRQTTKLNTQTTQLNPQMNPQTTQSNAQPTPQTSSYSMLRWKHLTSALAALSSALTMDNVVAENVPAMHARRADVELLRARLAEEPTRYGLAVQSRGTLLGNAATYYRGAAKLAAAKGGEQGFEREMRARERVVKMMQGELGMEQMDGLRDVLEDMKAEGLL